MCKGRIIVFSTFFCDHKMAVFLSCADVAIWLKMESGGRIAVGKSE